MSLFVNLPLVSQWIKKIDSDIQTYSFPVAMKKLLLRYGVSLVIKKKTSTVTELLSQKAVLVVANHPNEIDVPVLLASLEPRDDLYMISVSSMMGISANIDRHLIPVYVNHRMKDKKRTRVTNKVFRKIHNDYRFSEDEAHQKNIESIFLAVNKLNEGAAVVIFPEGSDIFRGWQSGIGHIVHSLASPEKVFIQYTYIENTKSWHLLGILPMIRKLIPDYKVTFGKPMTADKLKENNPKITTKVMELKYKKWVDKVRQST